MTNDPTWYGWVSEKIAEAGIDDLATGKRLVHVGNARRVLGSYNRLPYHVQKDVVKELVDMGFFSWHNRYYLSYEKKDEDKEDGQ